MTRKGSCLGLQNYIFIQLQYLFFLSEMICQCTIDFLGLCLFTNKDTHPIFPQWSQWDERRKKKVILYNFLTLRVFMDEILIYLDVQFKILIFKNYLYGTLSLIFAQTSYLVEIIFIYRVINYKYIVCLFRGCPFLQQR